jgi:hypothetical protein
MKMTFFAACIVFFVSACGETREVMELPESLTPYDTSEFYPDILDPENVSAHPDSLLLHE